MNRTGLNEGNSERTRRLAGRLRSARNQFILLGFIGQGLTWQDGWLAVLFVLLWLGCLAWPRRVQHRATGWEAVVLALGCLGGYGLAVSTGQSPHFFLGYGLVMLQAVRLLRELNRREKVYSLIVACLHLGVACTVILDYRFLILFLAAVVLLPRALAELAWEDFDLAGGSLLPRAWLRCGGIGLVAVLWFLVFPRADLGESLRLGSSLGREGSLLDSVLDPTQGALAQSSRVLLQIEGSKLGYLRSAVFVDFDGHRWYPLRSGRRGRPLRDHPGRPTAEAHRRVRVRFPGFLGGVLPADGRVEAVRGTFFRGAHKGLAGTVLTRWMWRAPDSRYEYWTEPGPLPENLSREARRRYTRCPPPSARVLAWLKSAVGGETDPPKQAARLVALFRSHFTYELGAPALNRLNPIEDFLFHQKRGHCERFASTLAYLLRVERIPSRVVIGYVANHRNWFSGWYDVRFNDAHAWTEAWFSGEGWVTLDATPRGSLDPGDWYWSDLLDAADMAWYLEVVRWDAANQRAALNSIARGASETLGAMRRSLPAIGFGVGIALLGMGLLVVYRCVFGGLWLRVGRRGVRSGEPGAANAMDPHYAGMLRRLARRGFRRRPAQTPLEFLAELEGRGVPEVEAAAFITHSFCSQRYGHEPISPETREELGRSLKRLGVKASGS